MKYIVEHAFTKKRVGAATHYPQFDGNLGIGVERLGTLQDDVLNNERSRYD